jgi:hypothetical protein
MVEMEPKEMWQQTTLCVTPIATRHQQRQTEIRSGFPMSGWAAAASSWI